MVNPQHCEECQDAYAFFQGTHWQRLLIEHDRLPNGYASIVFLTLEAQRFFLPAYLIAGLDYQRTTSGASAADLALFLLTPDKRSKNFTEFASGFSPREAAAIAAFFDYLREMDPYLPDDPYDFSRPKKERFTRYWSNRLTV